MKVCVKKYFDIPIFITHSIVVKRDIFVEIAFLKAINLYFGLCPILGNQPNLWDNILVGQNIFSIMINFMLSLKLWLALSSRKYHYFCFLMASFMAVSQKEAFAQKAWLHHIT